ncbi:hypothetical protein RJI07_00760 [Mycoplasmatota bacterium WC30]
METCQNCGAFVNENQDFCLECGKKIQRTDSVNESGGTFLYGLFSFFIPLLGLILWLVLRDSKPKAAKTSIRWAIGGFFTYIFFFALIILFYFYILVEILTPFILI